MDDELSVESLSRKVNLQLVEQFFFLVYLHETSS
jgi:hypothetical protein